ncbi:MAG: TonB-dependent receptor, partial [Psychroserpens sp.]|nr:TonB-dependent receptor [Psychroserpens sp.]
IRTRSDGFFKQINTDAAGNVIFEDIIEDNRDFERNFLLLGLGASYKPNTSFELYGNVSQNYRSVTFNDINIVNPAFAVDPDITDEEGFTADAGIRGDFNKILSYDVSAFSLFYNGRIGFVQKESDTGGVISERGNVGDAVLFGLESFFDLNLKKVFDMNNDFSLNYFLNASFISSEYTSSEQAGIEGNEVEFVPESNFKTGVRFGYKNFQANIQYTYLGQQFTDATNSVEANLSGVIGAIPEYEIVDLSMSYSYKRYKLEAGINNVLDETYFTRRATGYPGPGIIPSAPRNWFLTFQVKI